MRTLLDENVSDIYSEKRNSCTECSTNPLCQVISYINDDLIFVATILYLTVNAACPMVMDFFACVRAEKNIIRISTNDKLVKDS